MAHSHPLTCRPLVLTAATRPRPNKKSKRTEARVWVSLESLFNNSQENT